MSRFPSALRPPSSERPPNTASMGRRQLSLVLSDDEPGPLFLRIARAISKEIRRGRLVTGDRLVGTRTLAGQLGVHRNTVVAAYDQLTVSGWLEPEQGRGHRVRATRPASATKPRRAPEGVVESMAFELPLSGLERQEAAGSALAAYPLSDVQADVSLAPLTAMGRAYRRILAHHGQHALERGYVEGHPRLREAIATFLAQERGLAVKPSQVLVTRGSQMAIDLCAALHGSCAQPIAVEALSYVPACATFRHHGAQLLSVPLDEDGLQTEAVSEICERMKLAGIYVTPHHQYPTTVAMSAPRKLQLLELATRHRFPIFEDDYAYEYQYEGKPRMPLAAMDEAGSVIYIGTFSKVLAPGIRLGYVVGPEPWVKRAAELRKLRDGSGDTPTELAMAELLEDGELMRHARKMRATYRQRRDALLLALDECFSGVIRTRVPGGGLSVWSHVGRELPLGRLARLARQHGLGFRTARHFATDGSARRFIRLQFATPDAAGLRRNIHKLSQLV